MILHPRLSWALIVAILVLWLACAWWWPFPLRAASNPHLSARWDTATSATIAWQQSGRACLSVAHATGQRVFIGCYDGPARVALGGPQTDGAFRPQSGDVYILVSNGVTTRAPLIGRAQYLGVIRH